MHLLIYALTQRCFNKTTVKISVRISKYISFLVEMITYPSTNPASAGLAFLSLHIKGRW